MIGAAVAEGFVEAADAVVHGGDERGDKFVAHSRLWMARSRLVELSKRWIIGGHDGGLFICLDNT